ncbi:hypothetical protein C0989_007314 [Termitomyces sp. Mn162]|nr:hypothetical protein C0989_007314 [Termitomyces sp. Mn162]
MTTEAHMKSEYSDTFASRKLGLSCAECRRSKLKCDRRGCAGICPDGTLAATKGNKVLMAQAQKLSEQVKFLHARVRELEAALAMSRASEERDDGFRADHQAGQADCVDAVSEAIGSLSLGVDGQAKYHGESAGYDPISYNDFVFSIVNPIYGSEGYPSTDALHSHRLAVFFMVLANGNLYDESQPKAAAVAEQYYALARAAFSLDSILVEATCATVQALFLVFRFVYNSSQSDKEERWLLTGLTTRIAQTVRVPESFF